MKSATLLAILIGGCNMTLPASGYLSDSSRTHGEMAAALEDQRDAVAQVPNGQAVETVTIDTGVIEPTAALVRVNTEDSDPTDDLTNITTTPFENGALMFLWPNVNTNDVVLKHEANSNDGYLSLGADITLKTVSAVALLRCRKVTPPYFWEIVFQFPGESADPRAKFRDRYNLAPGGLHVAFFDSDDTWKVPDNVTAIEVLAVGGGGGGGGGGNATTNGTVGSDGVLTRVTDGVWPHKWIVTAPPGIGGGPGLAASSTGAGGAGGQQLDQGTSIGGENGTAGAVGGYGGNGTPSPLSPWGDSGRGGRGTAGGGGGGSGSIGVAHSIESVASGDTITIDIGAGGGGGAGTAGAKNGADGAGGAVLIRW